MRFKVEYDTGGKARSFETEEGTTIKDVFLKVSDEIAVSVLVSGESPLPVTVRIYELQAAKKPTPPTSV